MKKQFLLLTFSLLCLVNVINAQNEEYKSVASFNAGLSFFSLLNGKVPAVDNVDTLVTSGGNMSSIPTLQLSYDYAVSNRFSIGGAFSYNRANFTLDDAVVFKKTVGQVKGNISRTSVAARFLLHYGNSNKIDMYSGVRLGVGIWRSSVDADINVEEVSSRIPKATGVLPQIQVIPFAIRGYLTDNIGINLETAIGGPYFLSVGANYRF